jgi:hypothetical protein
MWQAHAKEAGAGQVSCEAIGQSPLCFAVAWCVWNGNVNWTTARLPKHVAEAIFADPDTILANSTRPTRCDRARLECVA